MEKNQRRADDTRQIIESIGKGATSTVRLQGKILKKLYNATIGAIWRRFWYATAIGKIFILVGVAGAVAAAVFAARDAIEMTFTHRELVQVKVSRAKVYEGPNRREAVVARVQRGQYIERKAESNGWWFVEDERWKKPGWIAKRNADKENKVILTIDYEMKGYGLAFIGSTLLMFIGFWLRRSQPAP